MIEYKGTQIKNNIEDYTVEDFENVSNKLNDEEKSNVEKYFDVLETLGVPDLDDMTDDEFFDIIKQFNFSTKLELQQYIELDGYKYVAHDGEFKLRAKDLALIEKAVDKEPKRYLARLMAIIYKREDLSKVEHYDEAHLKHKEKLFRTAGAKYAYPYLVYVADKINTKAKTMFNA